MYLRNFSVVLAYRFFSVPLKSVFFLWMHWGLFHFICCLVSRQIEEAPAHLDKKQQLDRILLWVQTDHRGALLSMSLSNLRLPRPLSHHRSHTHTFPTMKWFPFIGSRLVFISINTFIPNPKQEVRRRFGNIFSASRRQLWSTLDGISTVNIIPVKINTHWTLIACVKTVTRDSLHSAPLRLWQQQIDVFRQKPPEREGGRGAKSHPHWSLTTV